MRDTTSEVLEVQTIMAAYSKKKRVATAKRRRRSDVLVVAIERLANAVPYGHLSWSMGSVVFLDAARIHIADLEERIAELEAEMARAQLRIKELEHEADLLHHELLWVRNAGANSTDAEGS